VDTLITVTEQLPGSAAFSAAVTRTRKAYDGFEALRSLDTGSGSAGSAGYGDGVFDSKDAAFAQVRLWQDLNQDGTSQAGEFSTLGSKNITSIGLNPTTVVTNVGQGNVTTHQASVTRSTGTPLQASNLNLVTNGFYRQFSPLPVNAVARALPNVAASGWVRDLREAMSLGTPAGAKLAQRVGHFAMAV
jgi:hypothetical protein